MQGLKILNSNWFEQVTFEAAQINGRKWNKPSLFYLLPLDSNAFVFFFQPKQKKASASLQKPSLVNVIGLDNHQGTIFCIFQCQQTK